MGERLVFFLPMRGIKHSFQFRDVLSHHAKWLLHPKERLKKTKQELSSSRATSEHAHASDSHPYGQMLKEKGGTRYEETRGFSVKILDPNLKPRKIHSTE